ARGVRFFPLVGCAVRGGYLADGHGNCVPRRHLPWGSGPGLVEPCVSQLRCCIDVGFVAYLPRHRVESLLRAEEAVTGVAGSVLQDTTAKRGASSNRVVIDEFTYEAEAVIIASGGIGANFELIKENWPTRLGKAPNKMIAGVPDYVDGKMLAISE